MNDPYEILGVSPDAGETQIKKAYKALAKQAASLPAEQSVRRMAELDNAYDAVIGSKISGKSYQKTDYYDATHRENHAYSYQYNTADHHEYADIRSLIAQKRLDDADLLLNGIPTQLRTAEWHFLKGTVLQKKGWLDGASQEFRIACEMEPSNPEFKSAYESIYAKQSGGYRRRSSDRGCSGCEICTGLFCADCCCESLGGDLIPCC